MITASIQQRLFLLSCCVRTKEPLNSITVHASNYLLHTNVFPVWDLCDPSPSTSLATRPPTYHREYYSICSTEAIFIVLLCEDDRTLDLHHCGRIWLSPTYQCVFQFEISVNNALIMYEFQSFGNVFSSSHHVFCSRSFCRETRYIVLISENVLHQVLPAELHDKDWSQFTLLLQKCCAVHLYNEGMNQLP